MPAEDWVTGDIELSVDGVPLKLKLSVPSKRVKPQVLLPMFQEMANTFTDIAEGIAKKKGKVISCQKGCGACCRQPVPLAEIETYYIASLVAAMPEPRQSIVRERFANAAAHFKGIGWFERLENCQGEAELKQAALAYFREGIPCPFLEDESCSIHKNRPVICREYLVTSPASNCSDPIEERIEMVPLPINASDGVRKLGRTQAIGRRDFLPMVRALEWVAEHPNQAKPKTGEEWLGVFFG